MADLLKVIALTLVVVLLFNGPKAVHPGARFFAGLVIVSTTWGGLLLGSVAVVVGGGIAVPWARFENRSLTDRALIGAAVAVSLGALLIVGWSVAMLSGWLGPL